MRQRGDAYVPTDALPYRWATRVTLRVTPTISPDVRTPLMIARKCINAYLSLNNDVDEVSSRHTRSL